MIMMPVTEIKLFFRIVPKTFRVQDLLDQT